MEISLEQALQNIDNVLASANTNRETHRALEFSMNLVRETAVLASFFEKRVKDLELQIKGNNKPVSEPTITTA